MIHRKLTVILLATMWNLAGLLVAADPGSDALKANDALERLAKRSAVYHSSATGKTPGFVADPAWPEPLPNNWTIGQVGGVLWTVMITSGCTTGHAP